MLENSDTFQTVTNLVPKAKLEDDINVLGIEANKQLDYVVVEDRFVAYEPVKQSLNQIQKMIGCCTSFLHDEIKAEFLQEKIFFSEKYGRDRNDPLDVFNYNLEVLDHRKLITAVCQLICILKDFEFHLKKCEDNI